MNAWAVSLIGGAAGGVIGMVVILPENRLQAARRLVAAMISGAVFTNGLLKIAAIAVQIYFPDLPELEGNDLPLMLSSIIGAGSWWAWFAICNWAERRKDSPGEAIEDVSDLIDKIRGNEEPAK